MTDQNRNQYPDPERPDQPDGGQGRGAPLEDEQGRPQYGVRLPPGEAPAPPAGTQQPGSAGQFEQPPYGAPQTDNPYGQQSAGQPPAGQDPYNPYGQQPSGQPPYGAPQTGYQMGPVERPRQIDRAYWLILAAGAIFLVVHIFNAFQPNLGVPPEQLQMIEDQYAELGMPVDIQQVLDSIGIVLVVLSAIGALIYWLIARGIRKGSNVARIIGTILAAFSLLSAFPLVNLLWVVPGVIGIVMTYVGPANEYFRARAWERAAGRR